MRKGVLELCILSIIGKEDVYASDIIQNLKSADLIVVEGTLYPLLTRLKNAGLLEYRWQESKSGPPRKYYRLTNQGEKMRETLKEDWYKLQGQVNQLLESKQENQ